MINPAFLDELRARLPVSAVIGRRVTLKKSSGEWKGLSPFNKERTPSFFVNDQKGFYHDFSSGKHGDIFSFVMEMDGVTFPDAVERLAMMAGMKLREGNRGRSSTPNPARTARAEAERDREREHDVVVQRRKARWLWSQHMPIKSTIAETYLRSARGYSGPIPTTLGYLPATGEHPSALIAAFGTATEPEPGVLAISDDAVLGVHLIKLKHDGSDRIRDKDERPKIIVGRGFVAPIMLAPPNDLLGLLIAEGVEDALSGHEATGLGAWAAGGATRMPALADAIPSYIECVTILVDGNQAGRTSAAELAARVAARGIEVRLTPVENTK